MCVRRKILAVFSVLLLSVLSACASTPDKQVYAEITFSHLPPLRLNVGEIRVVNAYKSPLKPPNVEHELPVKIDQSVRRWVADRLQAVGKSDAFAVVTILDASVVEKSLKKTTGLSGFFTNDQSEEYVFRVEAELKVETVNGAKGLATAVAIQRKTVPENMTLNERDQMYFEKTEALMRDFNAEMEKNIRTFLGAYLR